MSASDLLLEVAMQQNVSCHDHGDSPPAASHQKCFATVLLFSLWKSRMKKISFFKVPEWRAPNPVAKFAKGMSKADHRIESTQRPWITMRETVQNENVNVNVVMKQEESQVSEFSHKNKDEPMSEAGDAPGNADFAAGGDEDDDVAAARCYDEN